MYDPTVAAAAAADHYTSMELLSGQPSMSDTDIHSCSVHSNRK